MLRLNFGNIHDFEMETEFIGFAPMVWLLELMEVILVSGQRSINY